MQDIEKRPATMPNNNMDQYQDEYEEPAAPFKFEENRVITPVRPLSMRQEELANARDSKDKGMLGGLLNLSSRFSSRGTRKSDSVTEAEMNELLGSPQKGPDSSTKVSDAGNTKIIRARNRPVTRSEDVHNDILTMRVS